MSTMDERTDVRSRTRAGLARWPALGLIPLTGIGWLILAWIALRFAPASIPTVGVLLGVYFLVATINEFVIASVMPSWRWLHVLMGIIFAFGALAIRPALQRVLGARLHPGAAAHLPGHVLHHHLRQHQGGQLHLVARPAGRHPGDLARILGLPAVPPGTRSAAADLGRLLRPVPRHLRNRDRLRAPPRPTPPLASRRTFPVIGRPILQRVSMEPDHSSRVPRCEPGNLVTIPSQVSDVKGGESACRPGSVRPLSRGGGHPSGTAVADSLVRSTREHRAGRPRSLAQGAVAPLLTLLRVGFTEPPQSPAALVVSYTTVSPLPPLARGRFVFCGTVPRVTPGRRYRPPCPVEPGPSSPGLRPVRPPGRLTRAQDTPNATGPV